MENCTAVAGHSNMFHSEQYLRNAESYRLARRKRREDIMRSDNDDAGTHGIGTGIRSHISGSSNGGWLLLRR